MRIATWNVNSVRARLPRVVQWLRDSRPDVVCLQELKCEDDAFPRADIEALGYHAAVYGQKTYNGVAILSRRPADEVFRGFPGDGDDCEKRVVAARFGDLNVVSVYVVNGQAVGAPKYAYKLEWLERLRAYLAERFDLAGKVVVAGDFNVTFDDRDVHDPAAWREKILCSTPERERLRAIVDLGLHDAFRRFHEEGGHYTWWDFRTFAFRRGLGLRIDHVLATEKALEGAAGAEIDKAAREGEKPSDHAPLVVTLADPEVGP